MTARRDDAFRRKPATLPLSPEGQQLNRAIDLLTGMPEWAEVMTWLKAREYERWTKIAPHDLGALSVAAARHSLIVEIEAIRTGLSNDDRSD